MRAIAFLGWFLLGLLVGRARAAEGGSGFGPCLESVGDLEVVFPWSPAYGTLRRGSSQMWSTYPKAIVMPSSEDGIVAALACARQYGVKVTARSGGHGNAGQSLINGALNIHLSKLDNVTLSADLDTVVVQTGATAGKMVHDIVLASNGTRNSPVGQKPTVGMAGLTLGGGWGFFSRQNGLLCDQLISVRMVLPSGEIRGDGGERAL